MATVIACLALLLVTWWALWADSLQAAGDQPTWTLLSSADGDLPSPGGSIQQPSSLLFDVDRDGLNDFIIVTRRTPGPALLWYRRTATGWQRHVIEPSSLRIEAGGAFHDIDGDGDNDIVMGSENMSSEIWWWENPLPNGDPTGAWTRRLIKNDGGFRHHDMAFGDVDGDGRDEFIFWNQGVDSLFVAEVPANPRQTSPWVNMTEGDNVTLVAGGLDDGEGLAIDDIDLDGTADIVAAGYWFKRNTNGSYTANAVDPRTRTRMVTGQLIPGGRPEIVQSPGDNTGMAHWFEWNGTSWVSHDLLYAEHAHSLAIDDINLDGNLDIFMAEMRFAETHNNHNPDANTWVFYGDGAGNFTTEVLATGLGNHESRVGDLDGDGDPDLLVKPFSWDTPRVDVLLNNLNSGGEPVCRPFEQWNRQVLGDTGTHRNVLVDSADLNGDGLVDVVAGDTWYRNPGGSGDWQQIAIGAPFNQFAAAHDFDGDGDIDLLGTVSNNVNLSERGNAFVWARNDGSGAFTILNNISPGTGDFLQGVVVESFAGGTTVALSWHASTAGIQQLQVPADPVNTTWPISQLSATSQDEDLSSGDIDRDGDRDLLLGTIWLANQGNGQWAANTLFSTSGSPDRNELADINGDGRLDAVVGYETISVPGVLAWYRAPANPTQPWTEQVIATPIAPMSVGAADFDGDGDVDVVAGEHNKNAPATSKLVIYENANGQGGTWREHLVYTGDEHHDGVEVVDIDNDGDLDIVSIGWTHGQVHLYENMSCAPTPPTATAEPPTATPTAEPPTETPTGEPPTETPTGEPPTETPTGEPPTETPTAEPPTETPTGEPPTETPTAEPPTETPTGEPPTETPTGEPPTETPTGEPPTETPPATAEPSATPTTAPTATPVPDPHDSAVLLVSSAGKGSVAGIQFEDEDVLAHDLTTGEWSLWFDGSDVGLAAVDVNALAVLDDGRLLLSTDAPITLNGVGRVDDSDLLLFSPSSLGPDTAGTFSLFLDGSRFGLTTWGEDIDTVGQLPNGDLFISLVGKGSASGVSALDEDLIRVPLSNGQPTSNWSTYFDGSDIGLTTNSEDIAGAWFDAAHNTLHLSTVGAFSVAGLSGTGADVFRCEGVVSGKDSACAGGLAMTWQGAQHGIGTQQLDAVTLLGDTGTTLDPTPPPNPTNTPTPTPSATPVADPHDSVVLLISSAGNGTVGGVQFADEDVLAHDLTTGEWSLWFDGSDVGLASADVNALAVLEDGRLLISTEAPVTLDGLGKVDDSDLLLFTPSSLGSDTNGTFTLFLDGSQFGLTTWSEDIDAVGQLPNGDLFISLVSQGTASGVSALDEDLIRVPLSGEQPTGNWSTFFDGSDIGLTANSEDIAGAWFDAGRNILHLSTVGAFSVGGLSGTGADVFRCEGLVSGDASACSNGLMMTWRGAQHGIGTQQLDAITLLPGTGVATDPTTTPNPTNTPTATTPPPSATPTVTGTAPPPTVTATPQPPTAQGWAFPDRRYRHTISVAAGSHARLDKPVDVTLDFAQLLSAAGAGGPFNAASLAVAEVNSSGDLLSTDVPFQFDPATDNSAAGTLVLLLTGSTPSGTTRHFQVYFDTMAAAGLTAVSVPARLSLSRNVQDEGFDSYRITTDAGTYYYHTQGGGFSSLVDSQGNDWISWSSATGSAGEYRGVPNMVHPNEGGHFHPGLLTSNSTIVGEGPLKVSIVSTTDDGKWQALWEIYPAYARMTVLRAGGEYWFLYEGTPGGTLDSGDQVVRPNGAQTGGYGSWASDLAAEEWVYFRDATLTRSLFAIHENEDTLVDSYRSMGDNMTVFGFGRNTGIGNFLSDVPQHFIIGLVDKTGLNEVAAAVHNAYKPLEVQFRTVDERSTGSGPDATATPTVQSTATATPPAPSTPTPTPTATSTPAASPTPTSTPAASPTPGPLACAAPRSLDQWQRHVIDDNSVGQATYVFDVDLTGDGRLDIVTGQYWYENNGSIGGAWTRHLIGAPLTDVIAAHDFDGDSDLDFLGTAGNTLYPNGVWAPFAWARNDGNGNLTVLTNIDGNLNMPINDPVQGVAIAQFTPNGPLEIAITWDDTELPNRNENGIQVLTVPANPSTETWTRRKLSQFSLGEDLVAADIDEDGDIDLFIGQSWLRNEHPSANWTRIDIFSLPAGYQASRQEVQDIDNDGDLDAFIGYSHAPEKQQVVWYEQGGSPTAPWTEHLILQLTSTNPRGYAESMDVADMDGDGDVDLLVGEYRVRYNPVTSFSGKVWVMENLGRGASWRPHVVYEGDSHYQSTHAADMDNDGDLDIISKGWLHNRVHIYENKACN
jgi:hypothetical protein